MASFCRVDKGQISDLIPILRSRLPRSAHMLNMTLIHASFTEEMSFYTLNGNIPEQCWILGKYEREDTGQVFTVSPPTDFTEDSNITQAFHTASAISWNQPFEFVALERSISTMISKISTDIIGNITEIHPARYFYMKPEEARNIDLLPIPEGVELKTQNCEAGLEFLREIWPDPNALKYRIKIVQRLTSFGAFVEGKGVSRANILPSGYLGIATNEDYRGKGYASLCLQYLTKCLAQDTQLHPCAQVQIKNNSSSRVMLRAGFKVTHLCDFVFYRGN